MGRKSKYFEVVEPNIQLIEAWCRDGDTDEIIAKKLNIALSTFYDYKKKFPKFSEALKNNKEIVDIKVENALLKKALGYKEKVKKVKITNDGDVINYEETIVYAPDTTSIIYWLKNRKPEQWRDKQDRDNEDTLKKLDELLEAQKNA